MSLFSRLYQIVRSNVPASDHRVGSKSLDGELESGSNTKDDFNESSKNDGTDNRDQGEAEDPELAGYYANLEIPYGSDLKTAKESWKRLLRKYHPDLHSNNPERRQVAHELTQKLNKAHDEITKRFETDHAQ